MKVREGVHLAEGGTMGRGAHQAPHRDGSPLRSRSGGQEPGGPARLRARGLQGPVAHRTRIGPWGSGPARGSGGRSAGTRSRPSSPRGPNAPPSSRWASALAITSTSGPRRADEHAAAARVAPLAVEEPGAPVAGAPPPRGAADADEPMRRMHADAPTFCGATIERTLSNGMEALVMSGTDPVVAVMCWYGVGGRHERPRGAA